MIKKVFSFILEGFLIIWQVPQNLFALFMIGIINIFGGIDYFGEVIGQTILPIIVIYIKKDSLKFLSSFSAGHFIFINVHKNKNSFIKHEVGHTLQSRMLGPFYLLVVGIPSVILNIVSRFNKKVNNTYYERYPEKWANRLVKNFKGEIK